MNQLLRVIVLASIVTVFIGCKANDKKNTGDPPAGTKDELPHDAPPRPPSY